MTNLQSEPRYHCRDKKIKLCNFKEKKVVLYETNLLITGKYCIYIIYCRYKMGFNIEVQEVT